MPPKVSSPVQTRTLGSFFSKKETAPSSGSTEGASAPKGERECEFTSSAVSSPSFLPY